MNHRSMNKVLSTILPQSLGASASPGRARAYSSFVVVCISASFFGCVVEHDVGQESTQSIGVANLGYLTWEDQLAFACDELRRSIELQVSGSGEAERYFESYCVRAENYYPGAEPLAVSLCTGDNPFIAPQRPPVRCFEEMPTFLYCLATDYEGDCDASPPETACTIADEVDYAYWEFATDSLLRSTGSDTGGICASTSSLPDVPQGVEDRVTVSSEGDITLRFLFNQCTDGRIYKIECSAGNECNPACDCFVDDELVETVDPKSTHHLDLKRDAVVACGFPVNE